MKRLTLLRIVLTLAAIAGLLPVTVLFFVGGFFLVAGTLGSLPTSWRELPVTLAIMLISVFCLGSIWKIYGLSMSCTPHIPNKGVLIVGVLVSAVWGVLWAVFTQTLPNTTYIFMMPGLTAAAMLAIALKREASKEKQLEFKR